MRKNLTLIYVSAIALVIFSTNSYGRAASALSASITASHNVKCNGGNTGSATVTATGGSAPYTYSWSPSGGTDLTASNLSVGTYTVTVTDAGSSTATASVTITQPAPLTASITLNGNGGPLTAIVDRSGIEGYTGDGGPATAAEVYSPSCATVDKYRNIYISDWYNYNIREVNASTGIITTIAGNGIMGLSGDGGPATACELGRTMEASVDSSGNIWIADYTNNAVHVITNSTNNPWPNNINGGNPTIPGYIYLFNTPIYPGVTNLFFDVAGNMYLLDQGGPGGFLIVTNSTTNPWPTIINGGNPTVAGKTYTMASGGLRYQGLTFDRAGNLYYTSLDYPYVYVITKTSTNPWPALINSGNPTSPGQTYILYTLPTPLHCSTPGPTWLAFDKFQNLYVADYYANQIYIIPWQGGPGSGYPYVDTSGIAGYTDNGSADSSYINEPNSCMIDNENNMYICNCPDACPDNSGVQKIVLAHPQNVTCHGYSNGSAKVTGIGGTAPYTYHWSNGQTSYSISGLSAGVYNVLVTDSNGCTTDDSITITQPTVMTITHDSVAQNGPCNGLAAITISGATPPYNYLWTTGHQTTDTIKGLCAGTYCCRITDNNGCPDSTCVTVNLGTEIRDISDASSINIYPDPSNGSFTILIKNGELGIRNNVEVYNILGEKVYSNSFTMNNSPFAIDMSSQPNGIYLYRVITETGQMIGDGKVMITK